MVVISTSLHLHDTWRHRSSVLICSFAKICVLSCFLFVYLITLTLEVGVFLHCNFCDILFFFEWKPKVNWFRRILCRTPIWIIISIKCSHWSKCLSIRWTCFGISMVWTSENRFENCFVVFMTCNCNWKEVDMGAIWNSFFILGLSE